VQSTLCAWHETSIRDVRRSQPLGTGAVDPANPHPHGKVPTISDDGAIVVTGGRHGEFTVISAYRGRLGICATLMTTHLAHPATPTPEVQTAVRAATFEVRLVISRVLRKVDSDALTHEKP